MSSDFVTLMTFMTDPEAEVKRLPLEAAGIKTYITDAEIVTWEWLLGNAVGAIKLQVARDDAERAMAILKQLEPVPGAPAKQDNQCLACGAILPDDSDTCPKCGWSYGKEKA